jgi:hypothetical protein
MKKSKLALTFNFSSKRFGIKRFPKEEKYKSSRSLSFLKTTSLGYQSTNKSKSRHLSKQVMLLQAEDLLCLFLVLYFDPVIQKEMTGGFDFHLSFSSSPFKKNEKGGTFQLLRFDCLKTCKKLFQTAKKSSKESSFIGVLHFKGVSSKAKSKAVKPLFFSVK